MALYQNGILISGANTLPQMTLAEYQALPVSERPTYWERTDLNYNNIPASDVTYGSGSVEDALDDAKIFYKDVPIAGVVVSNYYAYISSGVSTSDYTAIGFAEGGFWDEKLYFSVNKGNYLEIKSQTASYTIPSNRSPVRMYFVKNNKVNETPLA